MIRVFNSLKAKMKFLFKLVFENNNYFFIGILLVFFVGLLMKDSRLETYIVMNPDSKIEFSTRNEYLEQTWAPHVKRIVELKMPCVAKNSFYGILEIKILTDDGESVLETTTREYDFKEGTQEEIVFPLEDFKADIGTRYRIQLRFLEGTENGAISIDSGGDYSGGSIDGRDLHEAAAFKFTFEKNSRVFWILATFFPFICIAFYFSVKWDRKIEETLAMSFVTGILVLYVFGYIEQLETGVYALYVFSIFCLIRAYLLSLKKKVNAWELCTPGLAMYGGIVLFFMIACQKIVRRGWDEYIHWGLAAKDMYYYDAFSKHIDSSVVLKRYPPFSTLLEYFFMYTNEVFSEGILFVAYLSFAFSLLIIIFKDNTWKNRKYLISSLLVICTLPIIFFNNLYSIYVDYLLTILFAYILICYFSEEISNFNVLRIGMILAAMILTKDIGLVLAGLFAVVVLLDALWNKYKKVETRKEIIASMIFLVITAVSFLSWQIYLKIPVKDINIEASNKGIVSDSSSAISASGISVSGIWDVITMQADDYKYEVIEKYLNALLYEGIISLGNVKFSYVGMSFFLILVACVIVYKKKTNMKYEWIQDKRLRLSIHSIIILAGYAVFLLITYLFSFSSSEALRLASHERYFATGIGGVCIAFCILSIMINHKETFEYNKIIVYILNTILVFTVPVMYLIPENYRMDIGNHTLEDFNGIEEMFRSFSDKNENVYYVFNNTHFYDLEIIVFKNSISPLKMAGGPLYGSEEAWLKEEALLKEENDTLDSKNILSLESFEKNLKEYDYVFLHKPGYTFAESYGKIFEEPETIGYKTYYRVENTGEGVILHYMGRVK